MSTHSICFHGETRGIRYVYPCNMHILPGCCLFQIQELDHGTSHRTDYTLWSVDR